MSKTINVEAKKANHGEKMIEIKVCFWTNDLSKEKNTIKPKHAWTNGEIRMKRNKAHEIYPQKGIHFNSLMEIPRVIEKILIDHDIKLHITHKMERYIKCI